MERYRAKHDMELSHPRIAQLDLAYHDIRRGRGIFDLLQRKGLVARVTEDGEIEAAKDTPPQTTRAKLRGDFIAAAQQARPGLHRRLGAPETERPGAAHGAVQGPVPCRRRAGGTPDRLSVAQLHVRVSSGRVGGTARQGDQAVVDGVMLGGGLSYLAQASVQSRSDRSDQRRQTNERAEARRVEQLELLRQFIRVAQQAERAAEDRDNTPAWKASALDVVDELWVCERTIHVLFATPLHDLVRAYVRALRPTAASQGRMVRIRGRVPPAY